ncbi:MAG: HDOD domain-containing protein [Woeseiaceae bacterium]|nr:HDOD domain-containing protein [Woeseiaceae bacterium]
MTTVNDEFRFVSLLALELDNGDIALPSLPDVVLKIRSLLADEKADFERISRAVSMDPALVSRLLVFANSAFYNRANIKIESLETAISRLGVEVVRNTAMSLAMKQLYASEKHSHAAKFLRAIWARGMKLSCMAFAVAQVRRQLNAETAYLCGLLHEIGKLYIVTKAEEFPELLGKRESFDTILESWNPQISKSIIESWNFPDEVAESTSPDDYLDRDPESAVAYVDIVHVAKVLLDSAGAVDMASDASFIKLGLDEKSVADVMTKYRDKLKTMQESLA